MKKSRIQLALGFAFAFALCMMTSCEKEKPVATGKIQGIVTNSITGEPIKSVNISLSPTGLSAVTGSDGRYQFNNLEPGQYTVQGMKEGYESNTKNITIVAENISSGDMTMKPMVSGFVAIQNHQCQPDHALELGNRGKLELADSYPKFGQLARWPRNHRFGEYRPQSDSAEHHG